MFCCRDQLFERDEPLVERPPHHDPFHAVDHGERDDVPCPLYPAAGYSGHEAGDGGGLLQGGAAGGAVPGDVGVEHRRHAVRGELLGKVEHPDPARREPAVSRDDAVAGIDGDDEVGPELLHGAQPELPVLHRRRADHHSPRAGVTHGAQIFEGADTTTDLHRHAYGAGYLGHQVKLYGSAFNGAVKVNDVDRPRPAPLPLAGTLDGVGVVLFRAPEVPLDEAHAPATPQVDGGEDRESAQEPRAHRKKFSYSLRPARLLFSGWNWTAARFSRPAAAQNLAPYSAVPRRSFSRAGSG